MSIFKVEVVKIKEVLNHPNADKLEILTIEGMGYKVISSSGNFKVGDLAFYFPIDSVIPDYWVEAFNIKSYYSKKLSAAKLRGIFSEGLLIPVESVKELHLLRAGHALNYNEFFTVGDDYTEYFEVTKYQYPLPTSMSGDAEGVIGHYKFPSPENYKRFSHLLIPNEQIYVQEKLHGVNFTVVHKDVGQFSVGSHNYFWKIDSPNNKNNVWVRAFKELLPAAYFDNVPTNTQIFGELLGTQDLKYGCKQGQLDYVIFGIRVNGKFLSFAEYLDMVEQLELKAAPLLYKGPYNDEVVNQWNNTDSKLASHMMEGVVINPIVEREDPEIGRVCLKLISDRYLLRKNGTELH